MNKFIPTFLLFTLCFSFNLAATVHPIVTQGFTYSPDELQVVIGDTVAFTIGASHPTAQVSESTWNANQSTVMPGGFGEFSSSFEIVITEDMLPTIYYVCTNHVGAGMKGVINISPVGIEELINGVEFEFGPNPLDNNQINYKIGYDEFASANVQIYALDGKLVLETFLTEREGTIFVNLSNGNYILKVSDQNNRALATERISIR